MRHALYMQSRMLGGEQPWTVTKHVGAQWFIACLVLTTVTTLVCKYSTAAIICKHVGLTDVSSSTTRFVRIFSFLMYTFLRYHRQCGTAPVDGLKLKFNCTTQPSPGRECRPEPNNLSP
jgi:hypothetical protein